MHNYIFQKSFFLDSSFRHKITFMFWFVLMLMFNLSCSVCLYCTVIKLKSRNRRAYVQNKLVGPILHTESAHVVQEITK